MKDKISGIILAGGQGQRFNHQDKGLILWQGKPLISHVINRIESQVDQLIINCNRNIDQYQLLGHTVCHDKQCSDKHLDFQGPLAGIQAALPYADHSYCLICPCDTPILPNELTTRLYAAIIKRQADVAFPNCNGRSHYLPVLITTKLAKGLDHYLLGNDRSMKGWYQSMTAIEVDFSDLDRHFANINSPEALTDSQSC
ncbi:MAG: molybdenum cofactor guanylyltransferase MobA [Pseudomonadales bacterium]